MDDSNLPGRPPHRPAPGSNSLEPLSSGLSAAGLTMPSNPPGSGDAFVPGFSRVGNNELYISDSARRVVSGPGGPIVQNGVSLTHSGTGATRHYAGVTDGGFTLSGAGDQQTGAIAMAGALTNGQEHITFGGGVNLQAGVRTVHVGFNDEVNRLSLQGTATRTGGNVGIEAAHAVGDGRTLLGGVRLDTTGTIAMNGALTGGTNRTTGHFGINLGSVSGVEAGVSTPLPSLGCDTRIGITAAGASNGNWSGGVNAQFRLAENLHGRVNAGLQHDARTGTTGTVGAQLTYNDPETQFRAELAAAVTGGNVSIRGAVSMPIGRGGPPIPSAASPSPPPSGSCNQLSALEPTAPDSNTRGTSQGHPPSATRDAAGGGDPLALVNRLLAGDPHAMDVARNLPAGQEMRRQAIATVNEQHAAPQIEPTEARQQAESPRAPSHGARSLG